jgi:hypothetical protein
MQRQRDMQNQQRGEHKTHRTNGRDGHRGFLHAHWLR